MGESERIRQIGFDAYERAERLQLRSSYENSVNSHIAGKFGEHTCHGLLTRKFQLAIDPVYQDVNRLGEADLVCAGLRIDVKTWQAAFWPEFGRSLAVSQLASLRKKADVIFWCSFQPGESVTVRWEGWNWLSDFDGLEPVMTQCGRHKVRNLCLPLENMRQPESFIYEARDRGAWYGLTG